MPDAFCAAVMKRRPFGASRIALVATATTSLTFQRSAIPAILRQRLDAALHRIVGQRPPFQTAAPELDHLLLFVDDAIAVLLLLDHDHVNRVRPDVDRRDAVAWHGGDYG